MFASSADCESLWTVSRDHYGKAFKKEPKVKCDVTRRYKVSKFIKLGCKNCKIKVIGLYLVNQYCVS